MEDLPVGVEALRRQAFDLSQLTNRVGAVENAIRGRLIPPRGVQGQSVGFDSSGNPALVTHHAFHLYQSAGSTTFSATAAYQSIAWTAETYDTANVFTPGASATTYSVPVTGWWLLGYEILFVSGAYGAATITFNGRVLVNAATEHVTHTTTHVGTGQPALTKTQPMYLTSGQTIELQLARSDGFAPTTIGGDTSYTNFWGRLLTTG